MSNSVKDFDQSRKTQQTTYKRLESNALRKP